jgi:hypothetical protein
MVFPVEVVLKGRDFAVTENLMVPTAEPPVWDDNVVRSVLIEILKAIARVEDPKTAAGREVVLTGFSWIVEPSEGKVVIAIEIPMGAAVAGPFSVAQAELDAMITRVLRTERQFLAPNTIH